MPLKLSFYKTKELEALTGDSPDKQMVKAINEEKLPKDTTRKYVKLSPMCDFCTAELANKKK